MLTHLRFGIPSLDSLFGEKDGCGILLPKSGQNQSSSSVSICISGPDGTGKSILGLHLAAHYVADCLKQTSGGRRSLRTKVFYISTDLKFGMAKKVWLNFGLDWPNKRTVPFEEKERANDKNLEVSLVACSPLGGTSEEKALSFYLSAEESGPEVYFVDLASATAGDDWGYVNRVLTSLIEPEAGQPRHLMVIDSVEGFETLVGERDAYGLVRERRSRIAQVMRSASDKCHTLLIVEEPKLDERLPEEFVTDVVLRLRSTPVKNYVRRTVEIEKARGHSHARGQHPYLIRSGAGSTTGRGANYDDPQVPQVENAAGGANGGNGDERSEYQSYAHVCHSLHHIYRSRMSGEGRGRPAEPQRRFAAFGIRYLDDMLDTTGDNFRRRNGDDERGLLCGTTTALIGNAETQKSPLGFAFLSRCFRHYAERFSREIERLSNLEGDKASNLRAAFATARLRGDLTELRPKLDAQKIKGDPDWLPGNAERHWAALQRISRAKVDEKYENRGQGTHFEEMPGRKGLIEIDRVVRAAAWTVGPPTHPLDGIPILLTTQDVHAAMLAHNFLPWLLRKLPGLRKQEKEHPGCLAALRMLMEQYTVCRRLEIHDLSSAVLIHIVQRAIDEAHNVLDGNKLPKKAGGRAERSWGIRVVIDDFSILKDTYVEISEEPLLLRFLVFYLGQEGVTTLLIDTQPGRPDTTVASSLDSELRSLVDNRIYTWRFPFYGEDRVAVAVIPPVSPDSPAAIRELRRGIKAGTGPEILPLVVDPHFEMYSGIEKGEPQPIPLEIWLFEELPAFESYIEQENLRYSDLFTPLPTTGWGNPGKIIASVPGNDYDKFRDRCYLQRDTRLDHTLVFQVDEFWMVPPPGLRRAGTYRPQWAYLNAATAVKKSEEEWEREWAVDPFRLFQRTALDEEEDGNRVKVGTWHRRRKEFVCHGYRIDEDMSDGAKEAVDRVPFMWDFGFLLCRAALWEESEAELTIFNERPKGGGKKERFKSVRDVWENLPKAVKGEPRRGGERPSWRCFLEACYQLAKEQTYSRSRPVSAFDVHVSASQALSCLILEVWASEIFRKGGTSERLALKEQVAERRWERGANSEGLIQWLQRYPLELFKAWLLLIEVLDIQGLTRAVKEGNIRTREPDPMTVAVRHWYKTASLSVQKFSPDDPVVPVGLPGNFSVRGDWFLAVAGGSRSGRLADRAIDLLSSRRANFTRLKQGLGLPTRRLVTEELRTCLVTLDYGKDVPQDRPRRESRVWYDNLIKIGGPLKDSQGFEPKDFHWFWRSGLANYHLQAKVWQDWLCQMVLWWDRMRYVERDRWVNGFKRYDTIIEHEESGDVRKDYLEKSGEALEAWTKFKLSCNYLIKELKQVTSPA